MLIVMDWVIELPCCCVKSSFNFFYAYNGLLFFQFLLLLVGIIWCLVFSIYVMFVFYLFNIFCVFVNIDIFVLEKNFTI